MKKNLFTVLSALLVCVILAVCVCIAVCYDFGGDGADNLIHTHELTLVGEEQATCTETGNVPYYVCSCGLNYKDDFKEKLEHDYFNGKCRICGGEHDCKYIETVTEPTCTEKGYTIHTCACGRSYTDGYTDILGHSYLDGECIRCGHCNYTVGLAYTFSDDGTYYICSSIGTATDTEIVIPSEYNGLPVKAIGERAFKDCNTLKSIIIPGSITSIELAAFQNSGLTEIVVPDSVKNIGNYAYYGCSNLTEITIPAGVTALESYTFTSCANLTQINFNGTVEQWRTIPHTDWLYISSCIVVCTDGTLTAGR